MMKRNSVEMQLFKDQITCKHILVVDDDPEELFGTTRILRKLGYITETAASGEEAIEKARQLMPDLILLDVVMQGMDGFETCKHIKLDHQLKEIFVVLLSSIKKTPDYKSQGLNAGADGFIERPFQAKEFESRIRSIMRIKSVEKELRIQRQWLRITLSSIGDGLIATDRDGRILFMNPVAERITGWSAKEARLRDVEEIFKIIDSVTSQPVKGPIDKVFKEGSIVQLDDNVLLITKNQKQIPVADSAAPIRDDMGGIVGGVLVFRDITEKVKFEQDITQALKDWGAMFQAIGQMTLIIDPQHGILDANDVALEKTGLSKEQITGKKCFEIIHGTSSPPDKCPMVRALRTGNQEASELKIENIEGDYLISCTPIFDNKQQIEKIVHVATDISELKKSQRALQESEEKYRSMMESFVDPLYICSQDLKINYMNPAMIKWIGRDAIGEPCHMVLHALSSQCEGCVFEQVANGEIIETNIKSPLDGRHYRVTNMPVQNYDGTVSKMTFFRDITDYLQAVSEKEIAQDQLIQAQKMESIGNLAGGIAHDFNNILFPIVGIAEMLMEDLPPGSPERENAEEIFKAGKRGSELVKQILSFSRQAEHKIMPTRIQNVVREVIKLSRSSIPSYIEIDQNIQKDCGMVLADPSQIHQVAMNLITNAYHAVEDSGGKISVVLRQTIIEDPQSLNLKLRPGSYAVLSISDEGHGISDEFINKIFDPYFTTKKQGKGTGLGLAVVYGIVKEHKGDIKVYSEVDKGSTFDIYLPSMKRLNGTESLPDSEGYQGGNERILLVDDEEAIVKLEKQMLERLGYTVTSRLHSVEALEAFRASPASFDLVVTDMSMPNIPGDELARTIKSIRSDVPIIICTGFSERIRKDNIKPMGIDGLLMKPIVKSDLAKVVRKVLDEAKAPVRD